MVGKKMLKNAKKYIYIRQNHKTSRYLKINCDVSTV